MKNEYEIVRFENEGLALDIKVSLQERTVWLTKDDMAILFDRDRSVIARHIAKVMTEEGLEYTRVCAKHARTGSDGKNYIVDYYNMDVVTMVGRRIKSKNGTLIKDFLDDYLSRIERKKCDDIVIFDNGNVTLPVQVSPKENTVWISKEGLVSLFATTRQNVEYHIANIYGQGELDGATCKEILQVQNEMGRKVSRVNKVYNLDMAISLGYRINTKNGIAFRRWATNVLKEYLLKGYAIDEARTLVTNENYVNLINRVDNLDLRLSKIEKANRIIANKVFFDGKLFEARSFLKGIFSKAEKSIFLVDPYADILALDYLVEKKEEVTVTLFLSSKSKLTKDDVAAFNSEYGTLKVVVNDSFHDRFIILDKTELYHVGASLNHAGRKIFGISKIDDDEYLDSLLKRLN